MPQQSGRRGGRGGGQRGARRFPIRRGQGRGGRGRYRDDSESFSDYSDSYDDDYSSEDSVYYYSDSSVSSGRDRRPRANDRRDRRRTRSRSQRSRSRSRERRNTRRASRDRDHKTERRRSDSRDEPRKKDHRKEHPTQRAKDTKASNTQQQDLNGPSTHHATDAKGVAPLTSLPVKLPNPSSSHSNVVPQQQAAVLETPPTPKPRVIVYGVDRSVRGPHIKSIFQHFDICVKSCKRLWQVEGGEAYPDKSEEDPKAEVVVLELQTADDAMKAVSTMHGGWINGRQICAVLG